MTAVITDITYFKWRPLLLEHGDAAAVTQRIEGILESWIDTPYMRGQCAKKQGVDCMRFVTAVFDELYRGVRPRLPNIPQDASLHNRQLAWSTMRAIMRAYGPAKHVVDGVVEPGDVVVSGPLNGGPGHAIFVAGKPSTMVHSANRSVTRTGVAVIGQKVFRIYRPLDKERWL